MTKNSIRDRYKPISKNTSKVLVITIILTTSRINIFQHQEDQS